MALPATKVEVQAELRLVGVIAGPTGIQRILQRRELIDQAVEVEVGWLGVSADDSTPANVFNPWAWSAGRSPPAGQHDAAP